MFKGKSAIVVFVLALALSALHLSSTPASAFPRAEGLDVDTIVSDPFAYSGEIAVRGGVLGVDADNNQFWIIDYREYKGCGVVTCALKSMTVKSNGELPKEKDVVEIKGVIEKSESAKGGFVFKATGVEVKE